MDAQTATLIAEFIKQGVLGIVIVALLTGYLVPKWVRDRDEARDKIKDAIIDRQSRLIEEWAAREAKRPRVQIPPPPPDRPDAP